MATRHHRLSKMALALVMFGLIGGFTGPRASAFSNSDYSGRFVCHGGSPFNASTVAIMYTPDGSGHYKLGTLRAALTGLKVAFDATSPKTQFCLYSLDASSNYSIVSDGTGFESLTWNAATSNPTGCESTFSDDNAITLAASHLRTEFSSANFLNGDEPGSGYCAQ